MIKVNVMRQDPLKGEKPHLESFNIPKKDKMKILDALNYINQRLQCKLSIQMLLQGGAVRIMCFEN